MPILICDASDDVKPSSLSKTYDDMPELSGAYSKNFNGKNEFILTDYFYNLHVGYRKGIDSPMSCIVYSCMHQLKRNHMALLSDTVEKIFPKTIDRDNKKQFDKFGHIVVHMWEIFEQRIEGHKIEIDRQEFNRPYKSTPNRDKADLYKDSTTDLYRTVINNMIIAGRKDDIDNIGGLAYYLYT